MLRSSINPVNRFWSTRLSGDSVTFLVQTRHKKIRRRKPRWMPMAPSKLFRILEVPKPEPDEAKQLEILENRYKTEIRSIRAYFAAEQKRIDEEKDKSSQVSIQEREAFDALLKENENENRRIAILREKRHEEDFARRMNLLKLNVELQQIAKEAEIKAARKLFDKEMENANYITAKDLDAAIGKALDKPATFNFAITLDGKRIDETHQDSGFSTPLSKKNLFVG